MHGQIDRWADGRPDRRKERQEGQIHEHTHTNTERERESHIFGENCNNRMNKIVIFHLLKHTSLSNQQATKASLRMELCTFMSYNHKPIGWHL